MQYMICASSHSVFKVADMNFLLVKRIVPEYFAHEPVIASRRDGARKSIPRIQLSAH